MRIPDFSFEKRLWRRGFKFVAGVDEVGRGSFAGPVVAGCCVFDKKGIKKISLQDLKIYDSKKLKPKQRESCFLWIKENALAWGVGLGEVSEINKFGIGKTTLKAFRRAVNEVNKKLNKKFKGKKGKVGVEYLLLDAFYLPFIRGLPRKKTQKLKGVKDKRESFEILDSNSRQLAIIKGDEKSFSIACASIVAKVYRDNLMKKLSKKYKEYGWAKNKGYGTKTHQEAIKKFGITKYHRKAFVRRLLE